MRVIINSPALTKEQNGRIQTSKNIRATKSPAQVVLSDWGSLRPNGHDSKVSFSRHYSANTVKMKDSKASRKNFFHLPINAFAHARSPRGPGTGRLIAPRSRSRTRSSSARRLPMRFSHFLVDSIERVPSQAPGELRAGNP